MRILALEPYYGGSHQAFLDGWIRRSAHEWTVLSLPAYKWKWRMRHSAVTFAEQVAECEATGGAWDQLFCSDMLPLAEFKGLVSQEVASLPSLLYFHENQLTYPTQAAFRHGDRDHHYAFTNLISAIAADAVWFNSDYHRATFFESYAAFLARMPDFTPTVQLKQIRRKSSVQSPGVRRRAKRVRRAPGPLRILWNARWEHDKNPDLFFAALRHLRARVNFRLSVVGESFDKQPPIFESARTEFAAVTDTWGYLSDRSAYEEVLDRADVVVSTAIHEFFGMAVAEAAAAGAIPIVPRRLAYPEIFRAKEPENGGFFYDGSMDDLVRKLVNVADLVENGTIVSRCEQSWRLVERFDWSTRAVEMDTALADLATVAEQNGLFP